MGKERRFRPKRRTYPGYLSRDEYEREQSRVKEMVEGFLKWDSVQEVGDTANFCIAIDRYEKAVLIKERNLVVQCPFKLSIEQDEVEDVVKLLNTSVKTLRNLR